MAKLEITDHTGHTTLEYTVDDEVALAHAKAAFEEAIAGRIGYAIDDDTGETTWLRDFDETAEHIVLVDALVGG